MKMKMIDGILFYLIKTASKKMVAKKIANEMRERGYYARIIHTSKGYEVWVSANPRWFYNWMKF